MGLTAWLCLLALTATEPPALHWRLDLRDGAQGALAVDGDVLHVTRTNSVGAVVLQADPIELEPNQWRQFEVQFHADDAPLGNLLLLRLASDEDAIAYDAVDRTAGWVAHSLLINAPPESWVRRVVTCQTKDEPRRVTPMIVLWGNPCAVNLKGAAITDQRDPIVGNTGPPFETPLSLDDALARLAQRGDATATVTDDAKLLLDGEPALPVLFKVSPYDNAEADEHAFGRDGIHLMTCPAKLGGNHNIPGSWTGDGAVDVAPIIANLQRTLRRDPEARVILDWSVYPYLGWGDAHPDECWRNAQGQRGYGTWGNLDGFADELPDGDGKRRWWFPSQQSQAWRSDAAAALAESVTQLRRTPYWKAVVGAFITGGHDGQFMAGFQFDHSPATLRGFRAWCRQRYDGIRHLNAAWRTDFADFDAVGVPALGDADSDMEAPAPYVLPHGHVGDYRQYLRESAWQLREAMAEAFKRAAGKDVISLTYTGGDPQFVADPLLDLRCLDGAGSMAYYPWRNPGYALGFVMPDTFARRGKLMFQEIDLRSWVGSLYGGVYATYIGAGTRQTWDDVHRKLVGASIARGHGWWYYDMNRFFNDPAIHAGIAAACRAASAAAADRDATPNDVVLVTATDPAHVTGPLYGAATSAAWFQAMALEAAGVPFDVYSLDDILADELLRRYKLYLFLQTPHLSAAQRRGAEEKLKCGGRTLLFMHDAGYVDDDGMNDQSTSDLVAMRVRTDRQYGRRTAMMAADHPLSRGVEPMQGYAELVLSVMNLRGSNSHVARYQPFWVDDENVEVLMRYHEDGRTAAATRRLKGWTSVYLAAPSSLGPALLHNLALDAGARVMCHPGQSLYAGGAFASIHSLRTGPCRITPPPGRPHITDLSGNARLDSRTLHVEAGRTYWLKFSPTAPD